MRATEKRLGLANACASSTSCSPHPTSAAAAPHAMAQSPLLRIPPKPTEEVDLAAAVGSLIANSYGQEPKSFRDQLSSLNRARQDAVRGAGSDVTGRDLLYKWFHMLEMLELRFPELRVPFPW